MCVWLDLDVRKPCYGICISVLSVGEILKGCDSYRRWKSSAINSRLHWGTLHLFLGFNPKFRSLSSPNPCFLVPILFVCLPCKLFVGYQWLGLSYLLHIYLFSIWVWGQFMVYSFLQNDQNFLVTNICILWHRSTLHWFVAMISYVDTDP